MKGTGHRGRPTSREGESVLREVVFDQSHSHPGAGAVEWSAVAMVILGALIGGVALITGIIWLAVPAVVVTLAGVVTGVATNIMEKTEDY